jgi:hypothetical protein
MANEFSYNRQDASVNPAAKALPSSGGGTASTASIDLLSANVLRDVEFEIQAPALGVTPLPNGETMTYKVEDSADDSSFATVYDSVVVQTGAGGAGAAAATVRFRVPAESRRYIRVTATSSASAGDASGSTVSLVALF